MIRCLRGTRREHQHPVLQKEGRTAVNDEETVEMRVQTLVQIQSSDNFTEEDKKEQRQDQNLQNF